MNYAIISSSGIVINVVIWNGKPPWRPPIGTTAIPLADGAGIGWSYVNGAFIPPSAEGGLD